MVLERNGEANSDLSNIDTTFWAHAYNSYNVETLVGDDKTTYNYWINAFKEEHKWY